jgi:hypothetical protein
MKKEGRLQYGELKIEGKGKKGDWVKKAKQQGRVNSGC